MKNTSRIRNRFSKLKALQKALELGKTASEKDIASIDEKLPSMKKGKLKSVWDKVLVLWERFKSSETPMRTKIEILGCLLYVILPTDLIFDSIPGIGFLDDVAVVLFIFKKITEVFVPVTVAGVLEKGKKEIELRLEVLFNSVVNATIISFIVTILGFMVVIVMPFGYTASCYVSSFIFLGLFVFWIFSFVKGIRTYGRNLWHLLKCIIKERKIRRGIERYVFEEYKIVDEFYKVVRTTSIVLPAFSEIPEISDIVTLYIRIFWKRLALFFGALIFYTVLVSFVVKPFLIERFSGLTVLELYFFPFTSVIKTLFVRRV